MLKLGCIENLKSFLAIVRVDVILWYRFSLLKKSFPRPSFPKGNLSWTNSKTWVWYFFLWLVMMTRLSTISQIGLEPGKHVWPLKPHNLLSLEVWIAKYMQSNAVAKTISVNENNRLWQVGTTYAAECVMLGRSSCNYKTDPRTAPDRFDFSSFMRLSCISRSWHFWASRSFSHFVLSMSWGDV